jgi:anti-sigma B factor antagonist
MSLKIVRRSVGDITILDFEGRNSLGEGAAAFRHAILDLVSGGRKKIILNLTQVRYSDSAGNGELVSAYTRVANAGGRIVLLNLSKRIKDLLQITKLFTVFEVFEDEALAIRSLEVSPLHCLCPICGFRSAPALLDGKAWPPQTCGDSKCGAQFAIVPSVGDPGIDLIESARIPTYAEEYFEIVGGRPFRVLIVGRLNLFTCSALSKLWRALPARIVLFDLHLATEITPEGRDALLRLVSPLGGDEVAAISLEGLAPEEAQSFPAAPPVYADHSTALMALGDLVGKAPAWVARFH